MTVKYKQWFIIKFFILIKKLESSIKVQSSSLSGPTTSITTTSVDYDEYVASGGAIPNNENRVLVQQILELRRRLDEDHQSYKKKLQHYQESQQKQAQLVAKLQQKVLQYKTKCNELELNLDSRNVEMERIRVCL